MTEQEKIRFIDYLRLRTMLRNESLNGKTLLLEGHYSDAATIASTCVFNDCGYSLYEQNCRPEENSKVIYVSLGSEDGPDLKGRT